MKILKVALLAWILLLLVLPSQAQMWNGQDTLYGNEWINYDQTYYKISVSEDGLYRIPYETMQSAGLPVGSIDGAQLQLFHLGEEQPLYVTSSGTLNSGDYVEFYGKKNRSELDRYLFGERENTMLNPWYSLVTDTSAYFLSWAGAGQPTLRYETVLNDLTNLPPKEEWYWAEEEVYYTNSVRKVYDEISGANTDIYHSYYVGEGFASSYSNQHNMLIPALDVFANGPESSLELRLVSNANTDGHELQIRVDGSLLAEESYYGARFKRYAFLLDSGSLSESVSVEVSGLNNADRYAIGGASLRYPKMFDADGETVMRMELIPGNGERYLEIENLSGSETTVLYDLTNRLRLLPVEEEGLWKVKLPAGSGERPLWISQEVNMVTSLDPIFFINYAEDDSEYLIITSQQLREDGLGIDQVQAYANYRASAVGGSYQVSIVNVDDLYEQFAYGLQRHPLSIRNFVNYLDKYWENLQYCFLIGKGQEYPDVRDASSLGNAVSQGFFHVPSFGWPASDNLMLADGQSIVPTIPLGRLAAISGEEVKIYLDKVQAMEAQFNNPQTIEERAWMKQILHLGGGSSAGEQSTIKAYLESMAAAVEKNLYGAEVNAFYKTSTDPIQTSLSEQIFSTINEGTSIITFFGHSSPGTFDFNIDNPDNYLNTNKYPLMLSLGCYSGNIFVDGRSIGERFTFYENKAAVAFGASRGAGFISSLGSFARSYYAHLGGDFYGQGIGDALRATLEEYSTQPFIGGMATLVEQFTLHGDPAIRLYPTLGPDYVLDPSTVTFDPPVVTADQDSFVMKLDVLNLGQNPGDSTVALSISRQLPDGSEGETLKDTVALRQFRQTFSYKLPTEGRKGVGLNAITALIDADDTVEELPAPAAEMNNRLQRSDGGEGIPLFIIDNTARPVYPPEFAIVGSSDITLKSSTTDALAPERTYLLEVDKTGAFNSPMKLKTSITQRGGVIEWTPDLNWQDSTIYYWRISPDSISEEVGYVWEESSFTFIEGSEEGWRQGEYWQWLEGEVDDLTLKEEGWSFTDGLIDVRIRNKTYDPIDRPGLIYNNEGYASSVRPWLYLDEGIAVVVSHPFTSSFWKNPPGANTFSEGDYGVPTGNSRVFAFPTETLEQRANLLEFVEEVVPEEYFIFIFSILESESSSFYPELWESDTTQLGSGNDLFSYLEDKGATQLRELKNTGSVPFIFMYQKGVSALDEQIASSIFGEVNSSISIPRRRTEGVYRSPLIGPSKEWLEFNWNTGGNSVEDYDSSRVELHGINEFGQKELLLSSIYEGTYSLDTLDLDSIRFLQLKYWTKDEEDRTPTQLNDWSVLYKPVPEIALDPSAYFTFVADTLQQGQTLKFESQLAFLNRYEFSDSIGISYSVISPNNEIYESAARIDKQNDGGTIISFERSTKDLTSGQYNLIVELNKPPQLEQASFNNLARLPFLIERDKRNPVFSVTFDGAYIIDGDYVQAEPEIVIRANDENPYFLLDDTSLIDILLTWPDGRVQRLDYTSTEVSFFPAESSEKNQAEVVIRPNLYQDSLYTLTVQARDASGNEAGPNSYEVDFNVINKRQISRVLNYPNPFSTSTRFVYTLTGQPPSRYTLQIMTVSGRVVRELNEIDLGFLKVGTHQTEYSWDGTDEFGDRLANGVYLYRFIIHDEEWKDHDAIKRDNIDRFFKAGLGKMVILR